VVADDTHAAGGVAAADWLAATFGGGDFNASGTGARASDVDDSHFSGLEGRENSASPSSYVRTLPDDDDVTPLLSPHNAAPGGSSSGEDFESVDRDVTHARLHVATQSDDDDDGPADTLEAIFGHNRARTQAASMMRRMSVWCRCWCRCRCRCQWSRCQSRCRSRCRSNWGTRQAEGL